MKTHLTYQIMCGMIALSCSLTSSTAGDEAAIVRQGKLVSAHAIGKPWTSGDGWLECQGTDNFLVATKTAGAGDFCVQVRLALTQLDSTAASLMIGHNHIGLDGAGRRLFVEGLQFGPTKLVGDATEYVSPGQPFTLEAARRDGLLVVRIDGKEVFRSRQPLDPVPAIALRPWRATMRVYEWTVSGNLQPVAEEALGRVPLDVEELQAARGTGSPSAALVLASTGLLKPFPATVHRSHFRKQSMPSILTGSSKRLNTPEPTTCCSHRRTPCKSCPPRIPCWTRTCQDGTMADKSVEQLRRLNRAL